MNNVEKNPLKKRQILPVISLIIYAAGAIALFATPQNIFFSPSVPLPTKGLASPLFISMLLLAATSVFFVMTIFQKDQELKENRISKETGKFISKNIEEDVNRISEAVLIRREQAKKDFNRFVYLIGILSIALSLIQAWKIFTSGTTSGVSIIYWGAYLAIAAAWFGYGIYYQNKTIMAVYGTWIFLEVLIINALIFSS